MTDIGVLIGHVELYIQAMGSASLRDIQTLLPKEDKHRLDEVLVEAIRSGRINRYREWFFKTGIPWGDLWAAFLLPKKVAEIADRIAQEVYELGAATWDDLLAVTRECPDGLEEAVWECIRRCTVIKANGVYVTGPAMVAREWEM